MSDKQLAVEAILQLPDDAPMEEIARRVEFLAAVRKGMNEIERGQVVSHDEVKRQIASWLTK